ncbi:MAG TPA: hypothetical protein VF901_21340 [Bradyrhizobium sp.]
MSSPISTHGLLLLLGWLSSTHRSAFTATLRFPIAPNLHVFGILSILLAGPLGLSRRLIRLHWNGGRARRSRSLLHFGGNEGPDGTGQHNCRYHHQNTHGFLSCSMNFDER